MATFISNDNNDYDTISRLLDEIEALKEIFQSGFIVMDGLKLETIKTIYASVEDSPNMFKFSAIDFPSFKIKLISELSIEDNLPSCIIEIILVVPVNYITKRTSNNNNNVNIEDIKCEEISPKEKKRVISEMQEISNNASDEETLYLLFQTGLDRCTELVEKNRETRLLIQNEMLQQRLEMEKIYQQSHFPVLGRRILFSHHIIADSKRSAVVNWAVELGLGGFSKIGWPGLILIEGEEENCKLYVQSLQRLRWKMLVVRGEQQESGRPGQTLDDLRVIRNNRFIEFGTNQMSEFAQACRDHGLEDLFFAALKMKPKSNTNNKKKKESSNNETTSNNTRRKKKGKKG
jgi:hypothetical protein